MMHSKPFACLFILLLLFPACSDSRGNDVVVDFQETIPVDAPVRHSGQAVLRVAAGAMISPGDTHDYYRQIFSYLSHEMDMKLEFVQRKTYAEVDAMLKKGDLDVAFVCAGPYVKAMHQNYLTAVAAPEVDGRHTYQGYLITGANSSYERLADLRGKKFAFMDPDSNTGHLVPQAWLLDMGTTPEQFFSEVIYSYSHDNSIMAVAKGLVDAACVDSMVWDFYHDKHPELASRTRIIRKSRAFGVPPIVTSNSLPAATRQQIAHILLNMHQTPQGSAILSGLRIDRFVSPETAWYTSLEIMLHQINKQTQVVK
jgi:phosphonate transport system substrate-binding protein